MLQKRIEVKLPAMLSLFANDVMLFVNNHAETGHLILAQDKLCNVLTVVSTRVVVVCEFRAEQFLLPELVGFHPTIAITWGEVFLLLMFQRWCHF